MDKELTIIKKTREEEAKLKKLASELIKECATLNTPVLIMMAMENDEKGTTYLNDGYLTGSNSIVLKDDKFKKVLLLLNGADIKPMGTIGEFNEEAMNYLMDNDIEDSDEEFEIDNFFD